MHVSDEGLAFLVREEGSIPYAYNDPIGHATFGVGHLLHHGPVSHADAAAWGTRSRPRADLVLPTLRLDMPIYEAAINALNVNLTQHEFDALVSLCFNIGVGGFSNSTVAKLLRIGNHSGAANAFLLWDDAAPGDGKLRPRRERERKLFVSRESAADWLRPDELRWIRQYDALTKTQQQHSLDAVERRRVDVLHRVMKARRKAIWRAAQKPGGWEIADRRRRYNSLLSRTQ